MKLPPTLLVLVSLLLVPGQARAESWSKQLKPDKTSDHLYSFTIKVEPLKRARNLAQIDDEGEFLQFHVTVKLVASAEELKEASKQGWRPQYSGELRVFDGKKFISACNVQPTRRDGEFSFSFQIDAKYAEKSGFTFAMTEGEEGSGISYWFYLKDFVVPAAGAAPDKEPPAREQPPIDVIGAGAD
jgi:hypothetical protein